MCHKLKAGLLWFAITLVASGCSDTSKKPDSPSPPKPASSPSPEARAELIVSKVELIPETPRATTKFTLNVDVKNQGTKASSDYDLRILFTPAGKPNTVFYCVERVHKNGIQPGETVRVFSSNTQAINDPGSYVLHIILRMTDGTQVNKEWPFQGLPRK